MKTLQTLIFLTIILLAASCKKEDVNQPPSKPKLLTPAKGAVVAPESITFTWEASTDAEGEAMDYDLALSSDSLSWNYFSAGAASSKTIANKSGNGSYYAFEAGKKYYWKVIVDSKDAGGQITGTTEGDAISFYTIPTGVSSLSKTSGDGFVNLAWTDPAGLTKVEVTFSPAVSGIVQPIAVNPGVGKVELQGMENETIYNFYVKAYNSLGHTSKPDTIKAMPLSPMLVHDADFNLYKTITIGNQVWLAQNMKAIHYNDGSPVGNNYSQEANTGYGFCYHPSVALNKTKSIAPKGFHIATDIDWKELEQYIGLPSNELDILNSFNGIGAIKYMTPRGALTKCGKALASSSGWSDYEGLTGNGTDFYHLTIYPSGYLWGTDGIPGFTGNIAHILTSTVSPYESTTTIVRVISNQSDGIFRAYGFIHVSGTIRCVKD